MIITQPPSLCEGAFQSYLPECEFQRGTASVEQDERCETSCDYAQGFQVFERVNLMPLAGMDDGMCTAGTDAGDAQQVIQIGAINVYGGFGQVVACPG